jgi:hypothetical protein
VRGLDVEGRDREQQRGAQSRRRPGEATPQDEREQHRGHAEGRHHAARGDVRRWTDLRRLMERHRRRKQINRQPGILVEAMVEVAGGHHPRRALHEHALVPVGLVAQTPAQRGESQRRRHTEDRDEGEPHTRSGIHAKTAIIVPWCYHPDPWKLLSSLY